jgi:hypothetical protein
MSRAEQIIYDQTLTKYNKHDKRHVEKIKERHFLEVKNPTPKNPQDWGGGGIGVSEGVG